MNIKLGCTKDFNDKWLNGGREIRFILIYNMIFKTTETYRKYKLPIQQKEQIENELIEYLVPRFVDGNKADGKNPYWFIDKAIRFKIGDKLRQRKNRKIKLEEKKDIINCEIAETNEDTQKHYI